MLGLVCLWEGKPDWSMLLREQPWSEVYQEDWRRIDAIFSRLEFKLRAVVVPPRQFVVGSLHD